MGDENLRVAFCRNDEQLCMSRGLGVIKENSNLMQRDKKNNYNCVDNDNDCLGIDCNIRELKRIVSIVKCTLNRFF